MLTSTKPRINLLVAYPYFKRDIYDYLLQQDPADFRLMVDSGAFTAWKQGSEVDLKAYCDFIKGLPPQWDVRAVQLDKMHDPEGTARNLQTMLDAGVQNVMPVFTRGDKPENLEAMYSISDYILLGGVAQGEGNAAYVKWFSEVNQGRKVHWLGFVKMPFIQKYKPTSVDSSSPNGTARFGNLSYYASGGVLKSANRSSFAKRPSQEFVSSMAKVGFHYGDIGKLATSKAWVGVAQSDHPEGKGFASFVNYCHHLYRAIQVERNLGTHVYLALVTCAEVTAMFNALQHLKKVKAI